MVTPFPGQQMAGKSSPIPIFPGYSHINSQRTLRHRRLRESIGVDVAPVRRGQLRRSGSSIPVIVGPRNQASRGRRDQRNPERSEGFEQPSGLASVGSILTPQSRGRGAAQDVLLYRGRPPSKAYRAPCRDILSLRPDPHRGPCYLLVPMDRGDSIREAIHDGILEGYLMAGRS